MNKNPLLLTVLFTACGALLAGCAGQTRAAGAPLSAGCHQITDPAKAATAFYEPGIAFKARPIERNYSRQNWTGDVVGAEVHVRATPGATPEYLQRALVCHAKGTGPAASPNDPLRPAGGISNIQVQSAGYAFVVSVFGNDRQASKDIVARATAMVSGVGGTVDVRELSSGPSASTDL
jgi:hypothetical protein